MTKATTELGLCQVRSGTDRPCTRSAAVKIWGVSFCEPCAREQEAYFAVGELTETSRCLHDDSLVQMLNRTQSIRRGGIPLHPSPKGRDDKSKVGNHRCVSQGTQLASKEEARVGSRGEAEAQAVRRLLPRPREGETKPGEVVVRDAQVRARFRTVRACEKFAHLVEVARVIKFFKESKQPDGRRATPKPDPLLLRSPLLPFGRGRVLLGKRGRNSPVGAARGRFRRARRGFREARVRSLNPPRYTLQRSDVLRRTR